MRILYLIPSLDGSGGAEQAVAALVGPLTERGVQLEVVTLAPGPAAAGDAAPGSDLADQVRAGGAEVSSLPRTREGRGGRVQLANSVRALVARRRPDLVHTTLFEADLVGRLGSRAAGTPVVSSLVNVAYGPEQRANPALVAWKLEAARWADRLSALGVRRFHALSPHVAEVMGPRLGIPAARIDVIPRGRDANALGEPTPERRVRVRAALGVGPDEELVVAAARHEFQKGLDVLVRAWPAIHRVHPDARLVIAGRRGNESPRLEALADSRGSEAAVTWLGQRDDVGDLLVAADVFVVPSRWEGFGSILVEAMALGATVVASDVGPIPWVVGTGWARLVGPDDPEVLARGVIDALDQEPAERDRRAGQGRRRFAQMFSVDAVADATLEFYRRARR